MLFLDNNSKYIISSNYGLDIFNEPLKVFDFNGNMIKEINNSNVKTLIVDTYYDEEQGEKYIISGNNGFVASFDYSKNKIYHKYIDGEEKSDHISFIIFQNKDNKNKNRIELIESCDKRIIRIWNFHSGDMIKRIKIDCKYIYGICLWDENHLFIGCGDNSIKLLDLDGGKVVKNINGPQNDIITVKTIILPKYGK